VMVPSKSQNTMRLYVFNGVMDVCRKPFAVFRPAGGTGGDIISDTSEI